MTGAPATLYEIDEGAAWISLNRPENRNALSAQLVGEMHDHLTGAIADTNVRSVVLTGTGPAFCAGADLKNPPGGEGRTSTLELFKLIVASPKPVIAAVNGVAFAGGLGLVGAADIVIAAEDVPFSFSEVRIGAIPAVISVLCIPKLGRANAAKLFMTGERFSGRQAVAYGLAHRAVPAEQLRAAVREEIDMIRLGAPGAVAEAKKLVREIADLPAQEGFALAVPWTARQFKSDEAAEGIRAFREKRAPAWAVAPQPAGKTS